MQCCTRLFPAKIAALLGGVGAGATAALSARTPRAEAQHELPGWSASAYHRTNSDALRAVAQAQVDAARSEAVSFAAWRRATAVHGWQHGGSSVGHSKPLLFVVADSLSIDWGPHLHAALAPVFRYGRKNLNCGKGHCRAWCPTRGEGPKDLVANPTLDGCNGGDSRHALAYIRHLAESSTSRGPGDERMLAPHTTPSRLSGTRADVVILNAGVPICVCTTPSITSNLALWWAVQGCGTSRLILTHGSAQCLFTSTRQTCARWCELPATTSCIATIVVSGWV